MQCSASCSPGGEERLPGFVSASLPHVVQREAQAGLGSLAKLHPVAAACSVLCVLAGPSFLQPHDTPGAEKALWNSVLVIQQQGAWWWGLLGYQHLFLSTPAPTGISC